ncbi:MAG: transcriptional initiation protein Tat [Phycisphaerae bacterium]|nr:transcriptional initiation protein Tat [Phycisphaerae bacterium]
MMKATSVPKPAIAENTDPCFNRSPLLSNPLAKLPLGSIRAKGWLRHQLDLMASGMTGRLGELSTFLGPHNGWFEANRRGWDDHGWEEQPYWLRGFYSLAVQTQEPSLLAEAGRWMDIILTSQDSDGYFGPPDMKCLVGKNGQKICDLWPHMIVLDAVVRHHEYTGDSRVIPLMTSFFEFCRKLPNDLFLPHLTEGFKGFGDEATGAGWTPVIQMARAGDMLPHLYWLYNRTGDKRLLDLALRFYSRIPGPNSEWLEHHVVSFTQRYKYAGIFYAQSKRSSDLANTEYWYQQHLGTWGQQPRGIFAADENIRTGCTDPRQGFETCGITEFNKSFYLLGQLTGNPVYADRCEDITFNHFPASQTPDLKALHYITASNQPQLDKSENHEYQNKGRQIDYSPHLYRCCQHNVAMGWPWFVEHLWQATADHGLACWLYAPAVIAAQVGPMKVPVEIDVETEYPFDGRVRIALNSAQPVAFPLYLRVPRWCSDFQTLVNGKPVDLTPAPGAYLRIERTWNSGDIVEIEMPHEISLTTWPRTGSVTVDRGPLSYSVRIEEQWRRCGGTDQWPEWEVLPASPWNYGLIADPDKPMHDNHIAVARRREVADQPWTVENAPIELTARAKKIPGWKLVNETADVLPKSPATSAEPQETITLIPLGCARLRIACLPLVR